MRKTMMFIRLLWIAFRLYLWHIGHNWSLHQPRRVWVVNCFQIVSLTYWSQLPEKTVHFLTGCELLSDCIFDILVTTWVTFLKSKPMLWIAFRLYLWHIGHNHTLGCTWRTGVVNCFQIVSLTYWSQLIALPLYFLSRCELLSDCIFDILVTTNDASPSIRSLLWIAFRLYLWHIGHNFYTINLMIHHVVNCFQIVSLTYWSQHYWEWLLVWLSCELLSDCIFDILVTT